MSASPLVLLRDLPGLLRRRTAEGDYRPEIDGLRFLAIAIVIVGHLSERLVRFFPNALAAMDGAGLGVVLQRPGLGVYLFFAVSGFVLATQARKAGAHPLSPAFLRGYFARRLLRIEPPYALLIATTYLFVTTTGFVPAGTNQFASAPASLAASAAGSIIYVHDLVWGTYPRLFPPGWSLEVEVQFYIVAPLFFAVWFALSGRKMRLLVGTGGLLAGSIASLLAPAHAGPLHIEASLLRYAHFFWLGLVLADAQVTLAGWMEGLPRGAPSLLGWSALALYLVLPDAPVAATGGDLAHGLLLRAAALGCVAMMFAAAFAPRSGFRRFCARPWISLVGGACYSLYLMHLQIIQAMTAGVAKIVPDAPPVTLLALALFEIVVVLVVGLAFYALVERVFMRRDWPAALWRRVRPRAPALAT